MSTELIGRRNLVLSIGASLFGASWRWASSRTDAAVSGHVVLLGDSIFDNGAYTAGAPDVVGHVRSLLAPGWRASLCAVDGARVSDLHPQVSRVPRSATHLVVAIGGNDALSNMDLLATPVPSTTAALSLFDQRVSQFEREYRAAMGHLLKLHIPLTLCTIYNGNLDPAQARVARIALMMFNDAILRVAFENAAEVIDLRLVCSEASDYANPIEPSGSGGRRIAHSILAALGLEAGAFCRSCVSWVPR
jgi:hypothetical protein